MKRPCVCNKDTCRPCWLFHHDERYTQLWGGAEWRPERVYLINLKRRPDRLAHALDECGRVGIVPRVFEAVDGRQAQARRPSSWLSGGGAWGCRESHRLILEECLRDNVTSVMILEDDVRFADDFAERFPRYIAELPRDWQTAFVGGQHLSMPSVVPGHRNIVRCGGPRGCHRTHAYVVRGPYIQQLHDLFANATRHIDGTWGDHQQNHVGIYAPARWLAYQAESKSDISGRDFAERRWEAKQVSDEGTVRPVVQQRKGCTSCGKKKGHLR